MHFGAKISSETLMFGLLPQHWAWGQLHFFAITWFPGSSGQGEGQGPESNCPTLG